MRSVSGVDLVSAALHSTLSRAQKKFNLNNPGSLSKRKLKKEKRLENKLKRRFVRLKNPFAKPILSTSGGSETSFCEFGNGDWNSSLKDFQVEFEPVENDFSSFISKLKEKYICLNPKIIIKKKSDKKVKKVRVGIIVNGKKKLKNISPYSETKPLLLPSSSQSNETTSEKDDDVDSGLGLDIFPTNTVSLLQQYRKKRLEARKEKKLKKKEAKKLEEQKQKLLELKKKKSKRMKDILSRSESNGNGNSEKIPQLPQPKTVIYPREKIIQGWKQKYHYGCGFHNLGNSCYMNATLQALFHTPSFVNWLLLDEEHSQRCRSNSQTYQTCLVCAMRSTLKESLNRHNQCIRPIQIHNKLKAICKHFTHCRQEDAHEFLRYLLESMERSYLTAINALRLDNRSRETTPLGQIFGGYLRTEVTCLKCNYVSTTFQPLAELQLDIRHVTTLEDAINNHFKKERLDNNDYKCEKCHAMSPATKQFSLEVPPIVLCLQLKRFTLSGGKINKPIHCNQRLNLNRFLHKSLRENHANVQYRLVGLVTHIGSSPNCGHYTAIAEASNGNFYQFDDSYVRPISIQVALNTDAYVIIYEMESNPQSLKSSVNGCNNSPGGGSSSPYKPSGLPNGIKPSSTITKAENSDQFEHKKLVVPFLKTPVKLIENGISKSTHGGVNASTTPNKVLNGYSSTLASLSARERTPVSFNFQKNNTINGTSGIQMNPKILFKNPNATMQTTSSYLTNSSRSKLSPIKTDTNSLINDSNKSPLESNEMSSNQKTLFNRMKASLSQPLLKKDILPTLSEKKVTATTSAAATVQSTLSNPSIAKATQSFPPTSTISSTGFKTTSSVKLNIDRPSLVAYDSDDENDDVKPSSPVFDIDDVKPETTKKVEVEQQQPTVTPTRKLFPIFTNASNIKSWSGTESVLSTSIDTSRKRSLEKSKEDIYNEELDAGKTKKPRNKSRSISRSPIRDYTSSRCQDKSSSSSSSSSTNPNKIQRYVDNRRSFGEQMQSLQHQTILSSTSTSTSTSSKPSNGYHNNQNGYDNNNNRRSNDNSSAESNGSNSSSSRGNSNNNNNNDYFARKGYHYNKNNYGYNNFKRYNNNSNSNYYSTNNSSSPVSSYNNKYKNYQNNNNNGWRHNNGRNNDRGRYNGGSSYYGRAR